MEAQIRMSHEHFANTHYEVKVLGEGQWGTSYLAMSKSAADEIRARLYSTDKGRMYAELRSKLLAVKFSKKGVQLENEIQNLTQALPAKHTRIVETFGAHNDGHVKWLKTRYMTGGDLARFGDKFPEAITESFIWHVGYQVVEGLAHLYFGANVANGMTADPTWPSISHGDMDAENIFLGPASSGQGCGNYPELVIADFGNSKNHGMAVDVEECQIRDLHLANGILEFLRMDCPGDIVDDDVLVDKLASIGALRAKNINKDSLLKFFCDWMAVADVQRKKHFAPMPANAAAAIAADTVSDEELEAIFCRTESCDVC